MNIIVQCLVHHILYNCTLFGSSHSVQLYNVWLITSCTFVQCSVHHILYSCTMFGSSHPVQLYNVWFITSCTTIGQQLLTLEHSLLTVRCLFTCMYCPCRPWGRKEEREGGYNEDYKQEWTESFTCEEIMCEFNVTVYKVCNLALPPD